MGTNFVWLPNPKEGGHIITNKQREPSGDENSDYEDPPAATNGIRSESLTRLQSGFLHAISILDARNTSLLHELETARANTSSLSLGGQSAGGSPRSSRIEIARLTASLIAKNKTIKERNSTIFRLERMIGSLRADLAAERRKNETSLVLRTDGGARTPSEVTNMAQKKRKHADIKVKGGDEENPWVID
jgi:hypothetical protein